MGSTSMPFCSLLGRTTQLRYCENMANKIPLVRGIAGPGRKRWPWWNLTRLSKRRMCPHTPFDFYVPFLEYDENGGKCKCVTTQSQHCFWSECTGRFS
mmetsp:Transcript_21457/g.49519  ORF Transcript_21457/g.49519 Transcript_21457/m.49519 type:complete len:98 (+) Transcript_21457:7-300(+)